MYMRVQEKGKSVIVALCDRELIGKEYCEGELVLDLKAYASFYKGNAVDEEEAVLALREATSINLVGKKSVGLAKKLGLAGKDEIRKICGIPHVQVYRI